MTAARQERKPACHLWRGLAVRSLALALGLGFASIPAANGTTERIVVHGSTGLALAGYDPVAYFIDGKPLEGRAAVELAHAGAVWRFRNEGNRDAFRRDPGTYMPRYGGYDPTAIARGASAPGHPELFLVANGRLFLFRTPEARKAFQVDPDSVIDIADRQWPGVLKSLTP
jgi:hypothetical protein